MQVTHLTSDQRLPTNQFSTAPGQSLFSWAELKYQTRRRFSSLRSLNKKIIVLALVVIPIVAVVVGSQYIKNSQDARSSASVKDGPALIVLSPSKTTIGQGELEETQILVTTDGRQVVGFQLVAKLTGSIPGNLELVPQTIPGLQLVASSIDSVADGKELKLVYLVSLDNQYVDPVTGQTKVQPFVSTTPILLGLLRFYGQSSGSMTVTFNANSTLIIESGTNSDLAQIPPTLTYTYGSIVASPSPSPVVSLAPSASPSPLGSPLPSSTTNTKPGKGRRK